MRILVTLKSQICTEFSEWIGAENDRSNYKKQIFFRSL